MKTYKVILKDKREAFVDAEGHRLDGNQRRFTVEGKVIPDIFFYEDQVVGISIEVEDIDAPMAGFG